MPTKAAGLLNKEICKLKLLVTDRCNMACPYCFVKDTGADMPWLAAKKAADLFIRSRGEKKLVSFFGGEPMLQFNLIQAISRYLEKQAGVYRKDLTLSIITNAVLLGPEHLRFFRAHDFRIAVSMAGTQADHDAFRPLRSGHGSYQAVVKKLPMIFEMMGPDNVGVSFCVFPQTVERLKENFSHLHDLGFRYFNFEIIRDFQPWDTARIRMFLDGAGQISRRAISSVETKDPIFINPVNWELARARLSRSRDAVCPFNYLLTVYPKGELVFSHAVLNAADPEAYVLGNLAGGGPRRYGSCAFDRRNGSCRGCLGRYFAGHTADKGGDVVHNILDGLTLGAARIVSDRAGSDCRYRDYISRIRAKVLF